MAGHKKYYAFHEKEDGERIIKEGFTKGIANAKEALVVAKYYREKYGYGEVRLERAIISFCKEHDKNFNEIINQNSIGVWVKNAMRYQLHDSRNIKIYHSEMIEIKKIKNLRNRKLLFASLVLSKSVKTNNTSDKYYLHHTHFPQVIHMTKLKITEVQFADILSDFIAEELLYPYAPERESVLIKFAVSKGSVAMNIPDPDLAMESYRAFFGGDIVYCANQCGKEIIKTTSKKYCGDCAKEKHKEAKRKNWHKSKVD